MTSRNDTFPPDHEPTDNELTDAELDIALAAGDTQLLDHVRAHSDPAAALVALLTDTPDSRPDGPTRLSSSAGGPPTRATETAAARIRARARARLLPVDLAYILDSDCDVVYSLVGALEHALQHALDLVRDLDVTLEHASDLVRDLDVTLEHASDLVRDLVPAPTSDYAFCSIVERAHDLAGDLDRIWSIQPVDASGADLAELTELTMPDPARQGWALLDGAVLDGVVWDEHTRWPTNLRERVAARSEEIAPGVYRVRGGTERTPQLVP